jgi:ATP-dependent Lon protease
VLDPEQNNKFQDHYLELDYDLSDIMFVTTANSLNLPQPLLDRMEIIRLRAIPRTRRSRSRSAPDPKQIEAHGLKDGELTSRRRASRAHPHYTREAGVRTLEREIAKVAAKALRRSSKARPSGSS